MPVQKHDDRLWQSGQPAMCKEIVPGTVAKHQYSQNLRWTENPLPKSYDDSTRALPKLPDVVRIHTHTPWCPTAKKLK